MAHPSETQQNLQSYAEEEHKSFSTICFEQLVLPEELRFHRSIYVKFPDLHICVYINEVFDESQTVWTATICRIVDNEILYEMTKSTPRQILKWLVFIRYGTEKYNRIRFVKMYRGNSEYTTRGYVKSCN